MKGLKIFTNGEITKFLLPKSEETYIALRKSIDCDYIDIIHAENLPEPYCMVVDDEGLLVSEPKLNVIASYLYGTLTHGQVICGDVIIMKDKYTPDGIETVSLDKEDFDELSKILFNPDTFTGINKILHNLRKGGCLNENA